AAVRGWDAGARRAFPVNRRELTRAVGFVKRRSGPAAARPGASAAAVPPHVLAAHDEEARPLLPLPRRVDRLELRGAFEERGAVLAPGVPVLRAGLVAVEHEQGVPAGASFDQPRLVEPPLRELALPPVLRVLRVVEHEHLGRGAER